MGINPNFFGKKDSLYQNFDTINSKSHNFAADSMGKPFPVPMPFLNVNAGIWHKYDRNNGDETDYIIFIYTL